MLVFIIHTNAQQRIVAECTITFKVSADSTTDKDLAESLKNSTKVVYIKGNSSRTDLISSSFTQSVIYDKTTGSAVVLREFGNNKVMSKLNKAEWQEKNKKFEGFSLSTTSEIKTILGYECKKAVLQTTDGNSFTLYYATAIAPSVKEFEYQFKDVPGLVLEYELNENGKKINYTASKINLAPVPASKFETPISGYRILN